MSFFTIKKTADHAYTLLDPSSRPFLSLGLNHIEESSLLHSHNIAIYEERYKIRQSFINISTSRIRSFGFNTIGWTPEYVAGDTCDNLHSLGWSNQELLDCGMPYMVALPVMEIQSWNAHPVYRDPRGVHFQEWCDYLARSVCAVHKDSPNCIGYFFVDVPAWARHPSGKYFENFDSLSDGEREERIGELAEAYYSTICNAVKSADPNHLIFGDRLDGNASIPQGVLKALRDHVDVLSVQYFCKPTDEERNSMVAKLANWQKICTKPVLVADIGNYCKTEMNPQRASSLSSHEQRGEDYSKSLQILAKNSWFIGWHWCGYIESSRGRGWGIIDPFDEPYHGITDHICNSNKEALRYFE